MNNLSIQLDLEGLQGKDPNEIELILRNSIPNIMSKLNEQEDTVEAKGCTMGGAISKDKDGTTITGSFTCTFNK